PRAAARTSPPRPRRCGARRQSIRTGSGQARAILDSRRRILVLDDERRVGNVEREQLARRELMIEPIDRPVLQVGEWIVTRGPGQLVLGEHDLLLPGVEL